MPLQSLLEVMRFLAGGICHQLPGRSLQVAGVVLRLCARCTGTYLGACIGLGSVAVRRRLRASILPPRPVLALFGLFFVAWTIDGLNSYLELLRFPHLYQPSNTMRLLTGTLEGLALSLTIWPLAADTLWEKPIPVAVVTPAELAVLLGPATVVAAGASQAHPAAIVVAAILSALGVTGMLTLLNALVLATALHREGAFPSLRAALPLLASSLLLGGLELLALSLARHWVLGF